MTRWTVGLLDAQVAAARARGDFDNLSGYGKPLEPDAFAGLSGEQRFEALLLRTMGEVAPEVALIRSIRAARQQIESSSAQDRAGLERAQQVRVLELGAALKARRTV